MNLKKTLSGLLTNRIFLYFVVVLTSLNIIGYLSMNNQDAVIFFSLIGFLMYNFSKNMIVVLLVALISTNLMTSIKSNVEGLTGPGGGNDKSDGRTTNKQTRHAQGVISLEPLQSGINDNNDEVLDEENEKKERKEPTGAEKKRYIDYAATLEEAYQNLEKAIDAGGMQQLNEDTKKLMKTQADLLNSNSAISAESIGPLMEKAKEMIQGLDEDTIKKFAGLAESFNKV